MFESTSNLETYTEELFSILQIRNVASRILFNELTVLDTNKGVASMRQDEATASSCLQWRLESWLDACGRLPRIMRQPEAFLDPQNASKSFAAGALPQNPLGELTALPQTLADGKGARCPYPRTPPLLSAFGVDFRPFNPRGATSPNSLKVPKCFGDWIKQCPTVKWFHAYISTSIYLVTENSLYFWFTGHKMQHVYSDYWEGMSTNRVLPHLVDC